MSASAVETPGKIIVGPQPGPQTEFLTSIADIVFYGGAAGGGKTVGLLLEPLRHWTNPLFGGVIFRRSSVEIRNEGGLWDESMKLYAPMGAYPVESYLEWTFPHGSRMKFAHLELERSVLNWHGSQIPFIGFDELTSFTEYQFMYMLSRNRSGSGIPPYIRATCNPDADSWVKRWIAWYLDDKGYPIKERSGKIRYFIRLSDDSIAWANSSEELIEKNGKDVMPKSFTFISSKIYDNKILLTNDPTYLANLKALSRVERFRLLEGNWNIRAGAGNFFRREWFPIIDAIPANVASVVRYWDRAATKPSEKNKDPDWTAGLKLYKMRDGTYVIGDVRRIQQTPLEVERFIKNTASHDSRSTIIFVEQDPGSSGVADAQNYVRLLAGYDVRVTKPSSDKATRARPVSAQCEAGNVKLLRAPWNDAFLTELENFSEDPNDYAHDDQVDVLSGAFNEVVSDVSTFDVL